MSTALPANRLPLGALMDHLHERNRQNVAARSGVSVSAVNRWAMGGLALADAEGVAHNLDVVITDIWKDAHAAAAAPVRKVSATSNEKRTYTRVPITEVVWEEPPAPPARPALEPKVSRFAVVLDVLTAEPGRWARVEVCPTKADAGRTTGALRVAAKKRSTPVECRRAQLDDMWAVWARVVEAATS